MLSHSEQTANLRNTPMQYFVPPTSTAKKSKFGSLPFKLMESFVQNQWREMAQDEGLASEEHEPLASTK